MVWCHKLGIDENIAIINTKYNARHKFFTTVYPL